MDALSQQNNQHRHGHGYHAGRQWNRHDIWNTNKDAQLQLPKCHVFPTGDKVLFTSFLFDDHRLLFLIIYINFIFYLFGNIQ